MSTAVAPIHSEAPTRPPDVSLSQLPGRRSCTLVSVWPWACSAEILHNGLTEYKIAGAPRGAYSTLTVYDTQVNTLTPSGTDERPSMTFHPIPCEAVAYDLVEKWAGNMLGSKSGYRPGIQVIPDSATRPSPELLATLQAQQEALFNWYIKNAQDLAAGGNSAMITEIHRMAAHYMLGPGAVEKFTWMSPIAFENVKPCVACGESIKEAAETCKHCNRDLAPWCISVGKVPDNDPVLMKAISRIKALKSAESKASDMSEIERTIQQLRRENASLANTGPQGAQARK